MGHRILFFFIDIHFLGSCGVWGTGSGFYFVVIYLKLNFKMNFWKLNFKFIFFLFFNNSWDGAV